PPRARLGALLRPGAADLETGPPANLLERRLRGPRRVRCGASGDAVRRVPGRGGPEAPRPRRRAARLPGARPPRDARRPPALRRRAPAPEPDRGRDARGGDVRPVPGARRRPAGHRPDGPERLGTRVRAPRRKVAALDRDP